MSTTRCPAFLVMAVHACLPVFTLCVHAQALAHKPSDAFLRLRVVGEVVSGHIEVALRDLHAALALDTSDDGLITWGELRPRAAEIAAYVGGRIQMSTGERVCPAEVGGLGVARREDGAYATLTLRAVCEGPVSRLDLGYHLFADLDPTHRGLLSLRAAGRAHQAVLTPTRAGHASRRFELGIAVSGLGEVIERGALRLWLGLDHLLFLLLLLLPAVLARHGQDWIARDSFRPAMQEVLKVVGAFTVAHSLTLALGAGGLVRLPPRWAESAIALSVLLAALANLGSWAPRSRWSLACLLGLLHGFGFYAGLDDLARLGAAPAGSTLAFHLGVEAGQLALVAAFLPLAYFARRSWGYRRVLVAGGSAAAAVIAVSWSVERIFNVPIWGL